MTKIDDVMLAVTHCLRSNDCSHCEACPYNDGADYGCRAKLRDDIITLLKAKDDAIPIDWLMNYATLPTEFAISAWRKPERDKRKRSMKKLDKALTFDEAINLVMGESKGGETK